MVMALSTAAILLLCSGHPASEATPQPSSFRPYVSVLPQPTTATQMHVASRGELAYVEHRIARGDTLYGIAERYNTKIDHILQQNPKLDPQNLSVGQILRVPMNTVKHQKSREELAESAAKMVLKSSGEPADYIKMIPCKLTAYSNSFESTGKYPGQPGYGITASGQVAKEGLTVAVDPAVFPLHSILYIPGVGVRYAEDTGGAVKGGHIDIFMADDDSCRQFGVKRANVYVIEEGSRES